LVNKAKWNRKG